MEDTVTVPKKHYEAMQENLRWLEALESAGVDNWSGIDLAREIFQGEEEA